MGVLVACFAVFCAFAEIIPADRRVNWTPGVSVGVRGGVPLRTNLLDITKFGGTTNNGTVTGSIKAGTNVVTVSSVGDFAVGHGVWIEGAVSSIITEISGNTFRLRDNSFAAATSVPVKHDNGPVINNVINQAKAEDVVFIPRGVYVVRNGIYMQNKSNISLRGMGTNSTLAFVGIGGILAGPTPLEVSQAKQFTVASGVPKGATQMNLTSTVYAPWNDSIRPGELYTISTLNGSDPNFRVISVYGYERMVAQLVYVESVVGNTVTFSPPLVWHFTNQPYLVQYSTAVNRKVGIESLHLTMTNANEVGRASDTVLMQCSVDSWITDCVSSKANNYNLHVSGSVLCEASGNKFAGQLSSGTSHSGMIIENTTGLLVQNNIFDSMGFGLQLWGRSTMGCAYFANYFTNISGASIIFHNTHHMMNLFEANHVGSYFQVDGYYGSNSDATLFRNGLPNTTSIKRFSSRMNFVGNAMGTTKYNYYYDLENNHGGTYPLMELGHPNIGNALYTGKAPPMPWNYPQTAFTGNHGSYDALKPYSNISHKFTQTLVNVKEIPGNFAHWPFDAYGGYTLIFQDGVNTNVYHRAADKAPPAMQAGTTLHAIEKPSATKMVLNTTVTISNGWTMFVSSADTYQQLQTVDNASHIRHGNYVVTNMTGVVSWDPNISDRTIPASLLYQSKPAWWGGNRWPAFGPDVSPAFEMIPAQARHLGLQNGSKLSAPGGIRVSP